MGLGVGHVQEASRGREWGAKCRVPFNNKMNIATDKIASFGYNSNNALLKKRFLNLEINSYGTKKCFSSLSESLISNSEKVSCFSQIDA